MNVKTYEVRDSETGKLLYYGTAQECANKIGISMNRFYTVANKTYNYKYKNCYTALYKIIQVSAYVPKLNGNTRGALERIGEQSHREA